MTENMGEALQKEVVPKIAVRRLGEVEDIASAVSWAASEEASYMTGQVIMVDGGLAI
jgi:3-oxoacyl-[acyl-carrier protein] reductase